MLGLRFVRGLSLVMASGGHSSSRCAGLSLSWPLPLRGTGSRRAGSVVVAHGPSCSAACGIFPDQGTNPCLLHWQADSQPLRHQGSPRAILLRNQKKNSMQIPNEGLRSGSLEKTLRLIKLEADPGLHQQQLLSRSEGGSKRQRETLNWDAKEAAADPGGALREQGWSSVIPKWGKGGRSLSSYWIGFPQEGGINLSGSAPLVKGNF